MSDRGVRWLTLVLLAALGFYCVSRLELSNSIAHFIPSKSEAELVKLSLELVESPLARRMLISVSGGPDSARVARALSESLRGHPEVAWVEGEIDENAMRDIYDLYFERRMYLLSSDPEIEIPVMLERGALEERAARLRLRLGRPGSILLARAAPEDPLGLFEATLARIRSFRPELSGGDASDQAGEADFAVVMLGLRSAPFDSVAQTKLLTDIEAEFERLRALHDPGLVLEQSGVNRIAVATERSVKRDGNLISAVAITAVCLLFLLVFRSLRHLGVALLTPMAGFGLALAVAASRAEPVHGITIAFGFILIGVAIDYAIHLMSHHALSLDGASPRESVRRIRPSLLLSAFTTTVAFLALAFSDFPGLGEMGTFAAIGVPVGLGMTLFVTPAWLTTGTPPTGALSALARRFEILLAWLAKRRHVALGLFALCAGIAAVGFPMLHWQDDPANLMAVDPELFAESERVRKRVADFDGGRFVVGLATDREAALALNDRIAQRLEGVVAEGELAGMGSLHSFIWSESLQRRNLEALRAVPDLGDRIDAAYVARGFRPDSFRRFDDAVREPAREPLHPEDFAGTPLARVLDSLVELEGRWAIVTYLRGVGSADAIQRALEGLDGVHYIDQKEIIGGVYEGYRRSTGRAMAIGSVLVFLVLQLRYRDPLRGLLAFLPPALAALTTLGLFGIFGVPVNVVSAISLLVVLGMGVDYGIFAVDGARAPERQGATLSSLLISCLTSVFVFGILSFAGQPVLRSIGLTTATGILLALALSPAALVLASGLPERRERDA
jgi:predicted exporter